jgi:hypothetical protein
LKEYFEALERLITRKSTKVPPGTKITNDAVSLEAGQKKGTIKKSRPQFQELIKSIEVAAASKNNPERDQARKLEGAKENVRVLQVQLGASRERELSLISEIHQLKHDLSILTNQKIIPIRTISGKKTD